MRTRLGEGFETHRVIMQADGKDAEAISKALWSTKDTSVIAIYNNSPSMKGWLLQGLKLRDVSEAAFSVGQALLEELVWWKLQGLCPPH